MKQDLSKMSALNQLLASVQIHLRPDLAIDDVRKKIQISRANKQLLKKYELILVSLKHAADKVKKYPLYFSEFYPTTAGITQTEALEHHIHSYLEDMDRLREKIRILLSELKKDLKHVATNKKEVAEAMETLLSKVHEVFEDVSRHRNPHHHHRMKFLDPDLVKAEAMHTLLLDEGPMRKYLKEEAIKKLAEAERLAFDTAQKNWIKKAKNNSEQTNQFIEVLIKNNAEYILKLLEIDALEKLLS